jgi:hypothetical protein
MVECESNPLCVSKSNSSEIEGYNINAEELYTLTKKTIRRMRRQIQQRKNNGRKNRFGAKYLLRARAQFAEALLLSSQVPETTDVCGEPF